MAGESETRHDANRARAGRNRQRGRPAGIPGTDVHDALIAAMRECLHERIPAEITLKEIAERAGTSQEMVRYYFGGKDGLVVALIQMTSDHFSRSLGELESDILERGGNPTRHLVDTLLKLYVDQRHIARVSNAEFQKSKSALREQFLDNRAALVIEHIHAIVAGLVGAGIYRSDIDPRKMAMTIMNMVAGPVGLLSALAPDWTSVGELSDRAWADHLVELIDARCRAPS